MTHTRSRKIQTSLRYQIQVFTNHFQPMQWHTKRKSEVRRKKHYDAIKRKRERESHLDRVSEHARKKAKITWYQKMAMQILDDMGITYHYEKPIQHFTSFYLIDIYLPYYKICIEIDGNAHDLPEKKEADIIRDNFLKSRWYWVLRIRNEDVREKFWWEIKKAIICKERRKKVWHDEKKE